MTEPERSNTYRVRIPCRNCNTAYEAEIPLGILALQFSKKYLRGICKHCGCRMDGKCPAK